MINLSMQRRNQCVSFLGSLQFLQDKDVREVNKPGWWGIFWGDWGGRNDRSLDERYFYFKVAISFSLILYFSSKVYEIKK